jgi:UV DNA damage endonuclease
MIRHVGFACMSKNISTKYKTFRLASFTEQRWYDTIYHNINETEKLIDYCISSNIKMVRLSSDIIPFATHEVTKGLDYLNRYKTMLKSIGNKINQNDIRISIHPNQCCVLNSPSQDVAKASVKDLIYHYNLLNTMGVKGDLIIHVGGVYGDKVSAINRFIKIYNKLPEQLRNVICLENDDKSYTIDDVLYINEQTGVKICMDLHHAYCMDTFNIDFEKVIKTWGNLVPKLHVSSPKSLQEFRSHADMIDFDYIKDFFMQNKDYTFDVMIESKNKDIAVFKFIEDYDNLFNLKNKYTKSIA